MSRLEVDRSQRKALGKGLSALLPGKNALIPPRLEAKIEPEVTAVPVAEPTYPKLPEKFERFDSLPLDSIVANRHQPRNAFEADRLDELAQSIRTHGLLQPITVVRVAEGQYQIVAGERRWRAARLAGLNTIAALVRSVEQNQMLELALIENIQREDLNPIETASAFSRLIEQHQLSHEQVAERTGKDRSTITNFLRLLKLPKEVQDDLIRGDISMGHARALLGLPTAEAQRQAAQQVLDKRLSVRETEKLIKLLSLNAGASASSAKPKVAADHDANVRAALEAMQSALGTKVRLVTKSGNSGKLEIDYYSQDDLDRIYGLIVRS